MFGSLQIFTYTHATMAILGRFVFALCAVSWLLSSVVLTEPVQYCRFGDPARPNQDVDFCFGLTTQRNATTGAYNVYLTFTHTRRQLSAKGWTAIGVGDEMKGSLMFIVYGDPSSGHQPVVSIRASTGHHQPTLLTREQMGGGDLRVLRADWLSPSESNSAGTVTAAVSVLCYSCTLWPGTEFSATSTSQPWIWAWNKAQEFDVYDYDAHLKMHAHHAGNGGWGRFYVDMARAESTASQLPSVPVIRPGITALGTADSPSLSVGGWLTHNPVLHLHGFLMAAAFLLLFPAGVFGMRSGSVRAFKYHWIIQAAASAFTAGGAVAGLTLRHKIDTAHQIIGLALTCALGLQAYLGWRHHVLFVRIKRRTWISHAHIWTGRLIMSVGYVNLLLGLLLRGYSQTHVGLAATFIALESLALIIFVWLQTKKADAKASVAKYKALEAEDGPFIVASPEEQEGGSDYGDDDSNLSYREKGRQTK
ncbi:hypothetical protein F4779DRAFT_609939 [Xylariaceae sp. FL0662B]|nr:hypothetical protein F4779DRAFT_609939 [Xylariaceae sp. FL0662B]